MIYVPNKENYECFVVENEDVIRAYTEIPENGSVVTYRDFYINSNYIYLDGSQEFSEYTTLPVCLDNTNISSDVYYRNDFDKILVIFLILCIFCFYIPIKMFLRFFRRFN